jgi:4-alpha-glucanotransferase
MASVTTHDLPPTAGYLAHDHVRLRYQLGLLTESLDSEIEADAREQSAVIAMLEDRGALPPDDRDTEDVTLALHRFLTWTPSRVLSVSLTDAAGERRTQNQPGTIDEYPNWRVPLAGPDGRRLYLEDLYGSDRIRRLSDVMNGFQSAPRDATSSS